MKFPRNKYFLIGTVIFIFICIFGLMQFTKTFFYIAITGDLVQLKFHNPWRVTSQVQVISQSGNTKRILYNGKYYNVIKQKTVGYEQYSNPYMNISFLYPVALKHKQITTQLVSLYDPTIKDTDDNTLYIYSTTVPENSVEFKIPFILPGKLKETKIIKTGTFTANQEIYSDGTNEVTFLILRQNNQTIVMRIPKDASHVSQAITDIMNSIKTLN